MNTIETATNKTLMHHLTAFGNNDLDEIMLDYTENSIVLTDKGAIKGLTQIRETLAELFSLIPTGSEFEMKKLTVVGNVTHIIWSSRSATAEIPFGTDTFFIENDKIVAHTVSAYINHP